MSSSAAAASATGTAPVVEARAITKRFGPTVALDGVDLTVRPGVTHALVGRNGAGKSTLVSILTGLHRPDAGEVRFADEPAPSLADRDEWRRLVACVYQKSTIIGSLSVAENLFLNRQSGRGPIRWAAMRSRARQLLEQYDVEVDPRALAGELTVEQRQLIEIARALSFGARFIILDEPTAQLDAAAIERLFERMRALQAQGVTFLYISHHLPEIYQVCQEITVFRDARRIVTSTVDALPRAELVEAMTGEEPSVAAGPVDRRTASHAAVLEVESLGLDGVYEEVSFTVRAGEVVGLAGSGSSGKVTLAETLAGLRKAQRGTVRVNGKAVAGSVPHALAAGLGFVPRDRHQQGLVPLLSVAENATLPIADRLGPFGLILPARRRAAAERAIRDLAIKTDGPAQPVAALSGGNAQKVVMARGLANDPQVLVLISPTAGVDVRSKEFLLSVVEDVAAKGTGVLIVSDELDDLRPCDRVLVLFHGRVVRELPRGWSDNELVGAVEGVTE